MNTDGLKIISIAAVGKNGELGFKNQLIWKLPEDLKFFRDSTRGHIVLMGRKTMDSISKPLPQRINAVLTRDPKYNAPSGVQVFREISTAIDFYRKSHEGKTLFVVGGAQIYELAMPYVDEVWLTEIEQEFEADTFFPRYKGGKFLLNDQFVKTKSTPPKEPSLLKFNFVTYKRAQ